MAKKYSAVFFDNDGILVDTEHFYYYANRDILQTVGVDLTPELYHEFFLVESSGAWHLAQERGYTDAAIEEMRSLRNQRYLDYLMHEDVVIPGVRTVIDQLYGIVQMGVVTSSYREHFDRIHKNTGLLHFFDFVLTQGDYTHSKPHPEPYSLAQKKSGKQPNECIVIEDSQRGLLAAKAAGLECWVIPRGLTQGADFSQADRILSNINEIVPLILGD
ncbi:MAG: HAD family phosphatase [Nitrospirota bacterium]